MNFPLYIAKRYLRSKSKQNAVNIINFITFLVIVIGSAALFIVLSAFSGLKSFSLQFTDAFDPDLKAIPATGKFFTVSTENDQALQNLKSVAHYSKELEERVYLTFREKSHLATIKGVDSNFQMTTGIDSMLYFGNWGVNEYSGVIGIGAFNILGVPLNNYETPLIALAPKPGKGSINQQVLNSKPYNSLPLVLTGVYAVEENLDRKYVITSLPTVQAFLEKDSLTVSAINFKLSKGFDLESARAEIAAVLGSKGRILSRQELNGSLYKMLNTENVATYLIFTLVLIIALFNVVGAIIMMILDKQQNLRTLFALGSPVRDLRFTFFLQGLLTTCIGGLIGVVIGILIILSQLAFGWLKITPSLAYPVAFDWQNVLLVFLTIAALGFVSAKIASSRINKRLVAIS
ncbi:FtsX-like permease family protein [Croceivirga thetidis]|uniref:ABC transporter permease n=1 Tax=Croceivirga thetidis TaxID=2721623 RepID=A0ABX1GMV8_9FLAO|nr:FtsX-like permease family protein [Croceivirga thetidis]NKI31253.1 ABC transporter permease [Croceivirga thetidis]